MLGHPLLPGEDLDKNQERLQQVDFRIIKQSVAYQQKILNRFSLKYLAKFINEHDLQTVCVHGGEIPMREIKFNRLVELNLRE